MDYTLYKISYHYLRMCVFYWPQEEFYTGNDEEDKDVKKALNELLHICK